MHGRARSFNGLRPNRGFSEQWNFAKITAEFADREQLIIVPEQQTNVWSGGGHGRRSIWHVDFALTGRDFVGQL
jgi:hypothetical protein